MKPAKTRPPGNGRLFPKLTWLVQPVSQGSGRPGHNLPLLLESAWLVLELMSVRLRRDGNEPDLQILPCKCCPLAARSESITRNEDDGFPSEDSLVGLAR